MAAHVAVAITGRSDLPGWIILSAAAFAALAGTAAAWAVARYREKRSEYRPKHGRSGSG